MRYVGIDGGLSGAIAYVTFGVASVDFRSLDMPTMDLTDSRRCYDIPKISAMLSRWNEEFGIRLITIERTAAMPMRMGGSQASWWRGYSMGFWEAFCHSHELPVMFVTPQVWQKAMLIGTPTGKGGKFKKKLNTKQRSKLAASRLFPGEWADGQADALLLAEYGRRTHAR